MRLFKLFLCLLGFSPLLLQATVYKSEPENFKPKFDVVGCFVQHDDKILFLHRQDSANQGNLWGIPGGKIEKSESPKEAIIREVAEETGLDISSQPIQYLDKVYIRYPNYDYVFHMLKTDITENPGEVKLSFREHKGFTWVTPQDALALPLMPDEDTLLKSEINHLNIS